jgi:outer membrane receptor for ferric coprogen and ferric-rhodotorulic acid
MIAPSTPTGWRRIGEEDDYVTPLAAVVFDATAQWSLYGSFAESFASQWQQFSASGEPLDPRLGRQYEVGTKAEWFNGALQASLAIFNLRDTGRALPDLANPGFFANAGEVQSKGWEIELVGSPALGSDVQVGYSRLDSRFLVASPLEQDKRFSTLEPKHSLKAWMVHRFGRSQGAGLTLGGGVVAQSEIEFEERSQAWYAVFNMLAGYRFSDKVSIDLNVNNVLDKRYYSRLGPITTYNTFGAPRNVLLTVSATF